MANENISVQDKALINEIIENYSNYIDDLKIDELLHSLNQNYWKIGQTENLSAAIRYIMQSLVDELGSKIVNDLTFTTGCGFPYNSIEFNDHVVITKHDFMIYEFMGAKFNNGLTFKGEHLPSLILTNAVVHGLVDLTEVTTLDELNLFFANNSTCTVKLSNKLKALHQDALKHPGPNVKIEYTGTKNDFTNLIKHHYETNQYSDLLKDIKDTNIYCSDGVWKVEYNGL